MDNRFRHGGSVVGWLDGGILPLAAWRDLHRTGEGHAKPQAEEPSPPIRFHPNNPRSGRPLSTRGTGRPWRSDMVECGSMPRAVKTVAARSSGLTGRSTG